MATATAIAPTTLLVIEKNEMIHLLHEEHEISDRFIAYMVARKVRAEEDLVDQLFNSSEKRLARTLLLPAGYGAQSQPQKVLPRVSQGMLPEMIGATRPRVKFFHEQIQETRFQPIQPRDDPRQQFALECCPAECLTPRIIASAEGQREKWDGWKVGEEAEERKQSKFLPPRRARNDKRGGGNCEPTARLGMTKRGGAKCKPTARLGGVSPE